ncbi:MAG: T9SS type A sorting domain-containing protein [Bacteroidetes bacterium]|nr:T9SS type A sorting domain-containing protein [Bacteroidota bacterium]
MKKIYLFFISIIFSTSLMAQVNDVGIIKIIEPVLYVCNPVPNYIKVRIKNFGTQTQTSIPITFKKGYYTPITEIWTGVLLAGDSVDYTFLNPMLSPNGVSISFCVYTELTNDSYIFNDTVCKSVQIREIYSPSFINGPNNVSNGSIISYSSQMQWFGITNLVWTYLPSNGISINAADTTAILSFGVGAQSGILTVYAYDSVSHCSGTPVSINITIGTGINDINNNSFLLSQNTPNPASAKTNIEYMLTTSGNVKFELINLLGEKVWIKTVKAETGKNNFALDVSALPNGIYYYSIEFKGKKQFKKLVVSR